MKNRAGTLHNNRAELIADLRDSGLSFKKLGKKYGVTRQGVHCFYVRNKEEIGERFKPKPIPKPAPPPHSVTRCKICQRIREISREKWSYLTWSLGMIMGEVKLLKVKELGFHISALKRARRIPLNLGRVQSDKIAQAYRIYLTKAIPIYKIGFRVGLKNLTAIIIGHQKAGLKVPGPLFKWDAEARRKARRKAAITIREKKRPVKDKAAEELRSNEKRKR
jgi:hypothetical protein